MKRTHLFVVVGLLFVGLMVSGYQCSSTEITSAKLYIQQKNYDKALDALQKEIAKNPQSAEGYFLMGEVYGELGKADSMLWAFDKSLEAGNQFEGDINNVRSYHYVQLFNKGIGYNKLFNNATDPDTMKIYFDKAIESYDQASMIMPDSADPYKNLAFMHLNLQQYDEAIEPLEKVIELEQAADGYKFLGNIYIIKGNQANSEYKTSKDAADSIKAYGNYNKAIEILEEGKKLYPEDSDIISTLSDAYIAADKLDVALESVGQLVQKDPENVNFVATYGMLLSSAGQYEKAETNLLKALELDANNESVILSLADMYIKWGKELNRIAEAEEREDPEVTEKFKAAVPHIEKYLENNPDEAAVWETLGTVYSVVGDLDKAQNAFDKADSLRQ